MNYGPITHNQLGISSLVLLIIVVLGMIILWETNQFIGNYTSPPKPSANPSALGGTTEPICKTGEPGNCNDSNDVFILN